MNFKSLEELISTTSELAALPATTVRLLELLDDAVVEADQVLTIIGKDPALTANLLKLCNSAYYGMRRQIGSVKEALVLLGNQTVVTLAFATSMGDVLRGQLTAYGLAKDAMWHHALGTALASAYLMNWSTQPEMRDRAFTAGLVHDLGKLLLNKPLVKQMEQLPAGAVGCELMEAERRILGFDHCEAGAALGTSWHFPPMLVEAIFHHHRPEAAKEEPELVRSVYAGNLIATCLGLGGGIKVPVSMEDLDTLARQGMPEDAVFHLMDNLSDELDEMLSNVGEPI